MYQLFRDQLKECYVYAVNALKFYFSDPCLHNKCGRNSYCEYNFSATFGYDCVCKGLFVPDPNESKFNRDCVAPYDDRNVGDNFKVK